VGILLNEHVVLPFIDIRVLCAPHDGRWLLQGVIISISTARFTGLEAASDKVYQLLANGRWFSPGTPASSITNTGRHDMAEILLHVALNTKNQSNHVHDTQHAFFF
jgi:hypothetical protein